MTTGERAAVQVIPALRAEVWELESAVADAQAEVDSAKVDLDRLTELLQAARLLLARHEPGPDIIPEAKLDDDFARFRGLGPTAVAVGIAHESGGVVEAAALGRVLNEIGRYQDKGSAYATAYATLSQSARFEKVAQGRFRLAPENGGGSAGRRDT